MSDIVLVDSSILLNIFDVPGRNQQRPAVLERLEQLIEHGDHLFIPMAAIVEVGNHIAHVTDGRMRRAAAERFVREVQRAIDNEAPWKPVNFPSNEEVRGWLDAFPDEAMRNISMGDLQIKQEWLTCCDRYLLSCVYVWSLDAGLATCYRPAPVR